MTLSLSLSLSVLDSEDEVRVVKSAKERSLEAFQTHISNIRGAMKTRDFLTIQSEFDDLSKAMIKAKKLLSQGIPRPLVKILCNLEDYVSDQLADKTAFKTLSASQGRALNRMKLTLNKHNKPYHVVMKEYRKNPMDDDDDDDESSNENKANVSDDDDDDSSSDEDSSNENEVSFVPSLLCLPNALLPLLGFLGRISSCLSLG
jgi:translation initiation factor 3 subunit C